QNVDLTGFRLVYLFGYPVCYNLFISLLRKEKSMKKFLIKVLVGSLASVVILISVYWSYKIKANESISAVQTNTTIDLNQNNEDDSGREKQIKNEKPISILLIGLDSGALMYENE